MTDPTAKRIEDIINKVVDEYISTAIEHNQELSLYDIVGVVSDRAGKLMLFFESKGYEHGMWLLSGITVGIAIVLTIIEKLEEAKKKLKTKQEKDSNATKS